MNGGLGGERDWVAITFPQSDLVLAQRVRQVIEERSPSTAEAAVDVLRERLTPVCPTLDVRVRSDLGGIGFKAVYVFRDGSAAAKLDDPSWVDDADHARLVTDAAGRYVQVNDAAGRLFGAAPAEIIGRSAGEFTHPDARIHDADRLWRTLTETGRLHSLAVLRDGRVVEFITFKDGDGPGRNVTTMRELDQG